jgi:hypothetical protein
MRAILSNELFKEGMSEMAVVNQIIDFLTQIFPLAGAVAGFIVAGAGKRGSLPIGGTSSRCRAKGLMK